MLIAYGAPHLFLPAPDHMHALERLSILSISSSHCTCPKFRNLAWHMCTCAGLSPHPQVLALGYSVGRVEEMPRSQAGSAAAARKLLERRLVKIYTPGTAVDGLLAVSADALPGPGSCKASPRPGEGCNCTGLRPQGAALLQTTYSLQLTHPHALLANTPANSGAGRPRAGCAPLPVRG